MSPHTSEVSGLVGARDLGGRRRSDGRRTPSRVFFRSASLDSLSPRGWEEVGRADIRTVVDLRQPGERAWDGAERPAWIHTVHVDLDGLENGTFWQNYWHNGLVGTALYYLPHLAAMPERAVAALEAIVLAPPGGVLFHCVGGRDRTGMIALLLLAAARVRLEEIVADYMLTVEFRLAHPLGAGRSGEDELEAICRRHGTTTEAAFRSAAEGLDLERVLVKGGMTSAGRVALFSWRGQL